jgi:chitin disaccharide deacetylase
VTNVIVNADDYAMDGGVDAAILALAQRGAVTAASAMSLSPTWRESGRRLLDVDVSRGLHLDLTSPFAETAPPGLPRLMGAAFLGRLDLSALRHTIGRQLDLYEAVVKAPPEFIDGHQHVHQLPMVRDALMTALKAQYGAAASRIGVRLCLAKSWRGLKAAVIGATGGDALARLVGSRNHPANSDFAGVYGFSQRADLAGLWRDWLTGLKGERPLVMCHVAVRDAPSGPQDTIRSARVREWHWLGSQAFKDLCTECAITLCGWRLAGNANAE